MSPGRWKSKWRFDQERFVHLAREPGGDLRRIPVSPDLSPTMTLQRAKAVSVLNELNRKINHGASAAKTQTRQLIDFNGEPGGARTRDHRIKSAMLYQLSYRLFV